MTSPVDTSVKHFHNAMEGAPVLNGTAGTLVALLDACLITGFGLKSATSLTVAGGVATISFSGTHAADVHRVILVEGVTGAMAELNGEQRITAVGSGSVSFATAVADGTAAGTITFKMAPVGGWEKTYSGINKAVYRSVHAESTGMYLRIDDTGTTAARLRGYESMSGVDTGSAPFPSDGQISGGGYINKSSNANANAVTWTLAADARGVILNIVGYSSSAPSTQSGQTSFWGDFEPFLTGGDAYAFSATCFSSGNYNAVGSIDQVESWSQFSPRSYTGLGGSCVHTYNPEIGTKTNISGIDNTFGDFPSLIDGGLRLSRRLLIDQVSNAPRGALPGLYTSPQSKVGMQIAPRSLLSGSGPLTGRSLLAVGTNASSYSFPSASLGISFVDITGPWVR